jgi:very-short-patch-repair endonuclease
MTRAETLIWPALRNHRLDGRGFRRQSPIGPYFADFVCLQRKLIVEADGRTHETPDAKGKDAGRDAWREHAGYRLLRLPDDLVIGGLPIVVERIGARFESRDGLSPREQGRRRDVPGGAENQGGAAREACPDGGAR